MATVEKKGGRSTSQVNGSHQAPKEDDQAAKVAETVAIEAPMGVCGGGYCTNHIEVGAMTQRQRAAWKRLLTSLDAANHRVEMNGSQTPNGKVAQSYGDAVRWIGDRLADAYEESTGEDITAGMQF